MSSQLCPAPACSRAGKNFQCAQQPLCGAALCAKRHTGLGLRLGQPQACLATSSRSQSRQALQACADFTPGQVMQMVRLFAETHIQQQRLVRQRQGLAQLLVSP